MNMMLLRPYNYMSLVISCDKTICYEVSCSRLKSLNVEKYNECNIFKPLTTGNSNLVFGYYTGLFNNHFTFPCSSENVQYNNELRMMRI